MEFEVNKTSRISGQIGLAPSHCSFRDLGLVQLHMAQDFMASPDEVLVMRQNKVQLENL